MSTDALLWILVAMAATCCFGTGVVLGYWWGRTDGRDDAYRAVQRYYREHNERRHHPAAGGAPRSRPVR